MSGLAGLLVGLIEGEVRPGIYRWHGGFDVADVRRTVEHAGFHFAHVDGWLAGTKAELLAAMGEALDFPDHYGQNFDALADCLHGVHAAPGQHGVVLLWDGWSTLARSDAKAFGIALEVLSSRAREDGRTPFSVLLRGDGPDLAGIEALD